MHACYVLSCGVILYIDQVSAAVGATVAAAVATSVASSVAASVASSVAASVASSTAGAVAGAASGAAASGGGASAAAASAGGGAGGGGGAAAIGMIMVSCVCGLVCLLLHLHCPYCLLLSRENVTFVSKQHEYSKLYMLHILYCTCMLYSNQPVKCACV